MSHYALHGMDPASSHMADAGVTTGIAKHNAGCAYNSVNVMLGIYYPINSEQMITI